MGREGGREGGGRGGIHNVKCNDTGFQSSCSINPKCGHVWDRSRESCKSMTSGGIGTSQLRCPGRDVHIWGFQQTYHTYTTILAESLTAFILNEEKVGVSARLDALHISPVLNSRPLGRCSFFTISPGGC